VLDGNGNPRFAGASAGSTLTVSNGASTIVVAGGITAAGFSANPPQSQFPLFVDRGRANAPYTGSTLGSSQLTGFAQRIAVNPLVIADRAKLVVSGPGVLQGDATRPSFMLDAITKAERSFSGATGIAGGAPFTASVAQFARRIVETQGTNAEMAQRLDEGQQVALAAAEGRFADYSGVNIDQEMALLVQLQTAYGANARIMTAVRDMLDMLMRI
jgi:flagellar hook-associated protein 1 FlgK